MYNFSTSVSVWTHLHDTEWLDRNAGCTDVRLVDGVSRDAADALVGRLQEVYGAEELEIRDIHNVCVWASDETLIGQKRDARLRTTRSGSGATHD